MTIKCRDYNRPFSVNSYRWNFHIYFRKCSNRYSFFLNRNLPIEDTKTIPRAIEPAFIKVENPREIALSKLPVMDSNIVLYIPLPGTRGMIPAIT